jgi:hypothetical protein
VARRKISSALLAFSADDQRCAQARVAGKQAEFVTDLSRQLTSWRQHQGACTAGGAALKPIEQGQQKSRGLAAAGSGGGDQIASGQRYRDGG